MLAEIKISSSWVGLTHPTYFVADIAANHDGDLNRAKKLIALAAEAGANAAKFQNFTAEKIVSDFGFRHLGAQISHQKKWKKSVFEVYKEASIPSEWTEILCEECEKCGIDYATSPYDFDAADYVENFVPFYKIGSGDITWLQICKYIAKKGKPVLLATGASTMDDVERAVEVILAENKALVLMQCNTNYTGDLSNFSSVNLNVLKRFSAKWPNLVLGFSDHTPGHVAVLGAVTLGARIIEKHFTDDTSRIGPDHAFSMTPDTWRAMVHDVRLLESALGDGVKRIENNERETVVLQRRCLRAVRNLPVGHKITQGDFEPLRPAPQDSFGPALMDFLEGKTLKKSVVTGQHIASVNFED